MNCSCSCSCDYSAMRNGMVTAADMNTVNQNGGFKNNGNTVMRLFTALILLIAATAANAELPSATAAAVNQALSSGRPSVIDLGARTCIPCKKMAPVLESLSAEYLGRANVLFIDVHEDDAAARKFRVQMIPTQIFFNAQGREVKRHIGFMEKSDIVKELKGAGLK